MTNPDLERLISQQQLLSMFELHVLKDVNNYDLMNKIIVLRKEVQQLKEKIEKVLEIEDKIRKQIKYHEQQIEIMQQRYETTNDVSLMNTIDRHMEQINELQSILGEKK